MTSTTRQRSNRAAGEGAASRPAARVVGNGRRKWRVYTRRTDGAPAPRHPGDAHVTWWGWIIAGAILLGAELAVVDAQFYLVLVGTASIVVGLLALGIPAFDSAMQWAAFGVLRSRSMVGFRARVYR